MRKGKNYKYILYNVAPCLLKKRHDAIRRDTLKDGVVRSKEAEGYRGLAQRGSTPG